ncbi:hypothetical protein Tco_0843278 [Tanacetum coccineum]|uniref:Uncharacterized protein n=1 Tax=Tanacetum coccineum TaxID=301880 RepID=A0ABQ5B2I8_9ASTR
MSSITAQQTKLDLELVLKEKRLEIRKCNGRLNPGKIQRKPTFQVVLYALVLTPCYSAFLITAYAPKGQDFDVLPTNEEIVSFLRDLSHTGEINSLNDVVVDQMHQPWRTFAALINRSLSGKTIGLDKLRSLRAQNLRGNLPSKKWDYDETTLGRFHYHIDNKAYINQRDGEDSDQENVSDDDKTKLENDNESDSKHETDENESDSESDHEENKEDEDDEEEVKDELVKTPSNDSDDEDEIKITDKAEGDEDEEMDYTTSQLYDDVDIRLNEPVDTVKGFIQEEGTDATMTNVQHRDENLEILQVIEGAHVTLSTIPQKTEVPVTSSSHSSDLAAKFLNFSDISHTNAKIVSPMDVHVHHEVPSKKTP